MSAELNITENLREHIETDLVIEERWRIWAEICKHFPKGTDENELIHKIIFST